MRERGFVPKDHSERFRVLEENFPDVYMWIDKNFETYRDSYTMVIEKEVCDEIGKYVKEFIKKQKI